MGGRDRHGDAARRQRAIDRTGDLGGHALLDLQTAGIEIDHPGQLADTDHAPARQIGDADDRRHVMLAMGFETDIAQQHDILIAFDLVEGALENILGVQLVAAEILFEGADHAGRRVVQALASGIVAGPTQQGAHGRFGFGAARPIERQDV